MATQMISSPTGVTVFGSALIQVEPDIATLTFSVSHLSPTASTAFAETRTKARRVTDYLATTTVEEIKTSRLNMRSETEYRNGQHFPLGYRATMTFNIVLRDLELIETILIGVIDAGVENISGVHFNTTQLKVHRAEARRQAIAAAREKAEIYCEAASVKLGRILHIEDENPDALQGNEGQFSHVPTGSGDSAVTPGSISVGGAVVVAFAFADE